MYCNRDETRTCTTNPDNKAKTKILIRQFNEKFKQVHGSLICKQHTGFDISTPEGSAATQEEGVFDSKCPFFF
jgi:hypothetical protein